MENAQAGMINITKSICIISGKGGVGKTTITLNLGAAISQQFRKNVMLVDCNITASHLGLYLGMYNHQVTLNKVLREEHHPDDATYHHYSGMKVIPAALSVYELEGVDITNLSSVLNQIVHKHDLTLLDAAPGLGREAMATLKASDEIVYITTPTIPSIADVVRCKEVVDELEKKSIGIVVNMHRKGKHELKKDEIEYLTELPVLSMVPYDKNMRKSVATTTPIVTMKPRSSSSKEIMKLSALLMNETLPRRGILRRFW